jgi:hypothetical protein
MTQRRYGEKLSGCGGHRTLRVGGWLAAAGRMDGLRVCSMWTLYVESHVWGHDGVRTKHVMSNGMHTREGCPKVNPQPNAIPHRNAQHS